MAICIETESNQNDAILVSTTLVIVFITTIVFGSLTPLSVNKLNLNSIETDRDGSYNKEEQYTLLAFKEETSFIHNTTRFEYQHPNNQHLSQYDNHEGHDGFFYKIWHDLDEKILKPILILDWENCKKDHVSRAQIIKQTLNNERINN